MNAWMPGRAKYTPFTLHLGTAARDITMFRRWMVIHATKELRASPSEWRWEQEGDMVVVAAALAE